MASCMIRTNPVFSTLPLPDFSTSMSDSRLSNSYTGGLYPERFGVVENVAASSRPECRLAEASTQGSGPIPCKIEPDSFSALLNTDFSHFGFPKSGKDPTFVPTAVQMSQQFLHPGKESGFSKSGKDAIFEDHPQERALKRPRMEIDAKECLVTNAAGSPLGSSSPSKIGEPEHEVHIWTERERRKKMRSMFVTLHSMLPKVPSKADKSTIVDEAINYIKSLEQKMQRLLKKKSEKMMRSQQTEIDNSKVVLDSSDILRTGGVNSCFRTVSSSNVVFNMCGSDVFITICAGSRPNLLSRIFICVIQNHKMDVKNVQITHAADNRRLLMIHACVTDATRTSDADIRNVMQELIRCIF